MEDKSGFCNHCRNIPNLNCGGHHFGEPLFGHSVTLKKSPQLKNPVLKLKNVTECMVLGNRSESFATLNFATSAGAASLYIARRNAEYWRFRSAGSMSDAFVIFATCSFWVSSKLDSRWTFSWEPGVVICRGSNIKIIIPTRSLQTPQQLLFATSMRLLVFCSPSSLREWQGSTRCRSSKQVKRFHGCRFLQTW